MSDYEIKRFYSYIFLIVLFINYTLASVMDITYRDITFDWSDSFETNCYPLDGTYGHACWKDPIGWNRFQNTNHTFLGHINPLGDLQYMNGDAAPDGMQCLFVSVSPQGFGTGEFGIQQHLSTLVTGDTLYTLTVDIGNPKIWANEYHKGWPGANIYLLAGNEVLRGQAILLLEDGFWTTGKLNITVPANSPNIGKLLGIRLTNVNPKNIGDDQSLNEVLFDNVRLKAFKTRKRKICSFRTKIHEIKNDKVRSLHKYDNWLERYAYLIICVWLSTVASVVGFVKLCGPETFSNIAVSVYKYEERIMMFMNSIYEQFFYTHGYEYNGKAPSFICELNMKYNNNGKCSVCFRKYKRLSRRKKDILHCGHKYHTKCLRKWELQQLKQNAFKSYSCPVCRTTYSWKQKWRYGK